MMTFARVLGVLSVVALIHLSSATCDCGYTVNTTSDSSFALFMYLFETDFVHMYDVTRWIGWRRQEYNVSFDLAHGTFGMAKKISNVIANPVNNHSAWSGETENGGDAGLQLWVRAGNHGNLISSAEMSAVDRDMLYGSYRVSMKMTGTAGTCGAFFWFHNNSQEIDLEMLSRQFNATHHPINLVIHTPLSASNNYDANGTPTFRPYSLPFDPTLDFHEYRFDVLPDRISFYADGNWLHDMTEGIPTQAGHIMLNHWSTGNPLWSGGPPNEDAVMTVRYVKAYFNSTIWDNRYARYRERCAPGTAARNLTCAVPLKGWEGYEPGRSYFFTQEDVVAIQVVSAVWAIYEAFRVAHKMSSDPVVPEFMQGLGDQ
ncbi:glycoside hydrolase family 16 protein [Patellaria atrata CBS 101060]|uniref:Glycoside hydrolase family 16 protein n=1 Tax=Patellaria atrata CBS 101060 TaxID=1346257 RepID=A0A9P4VQR7_9PEZI|nr:glycoside hydrolase family 16 protein [Patellaria atrata CBS 101060]